MTDDAELERLAEWLDELAEEAAGVARYFREMKQTNAAKLYAETRRKHTAAAKAIRERADLARRLAEAEGARERAVAEAVSLFRAFTAGVASRDVHDGTSTREVADGWRQDSTSIFEETLRAALNPEPRHAE